MFSRVFGVLSFILIFLCSFSLFPTQAVAQSEEEALAELLQNLNGDDTEPPAEEQTGTGTETEPETEPDEGTGHDAAELLDGDDDSWELAGPENISVEEVGTNYAVIQTTEALFQGEPVTQYKIYYSNSSLETQDFEQISDTTVDLYEPEEDSSLMADENSVLLMLPDLDSEVTYYVVVTPVHPTDPTIEPLTMITNEVSFSTEAEESEGVSADTKVYDQVGYEYDQEANSVTLSWAATDVSAMTEINLRHQSEGEYQKVGETETSDESFTFTVSRSGNYFLKMTALNEDGNPVGKEHIQTIRIENVEQPAQPVQTPPEVGPTTDLIIALLILSAVFYLVYRFRKIEQ